MTLTTDEALRALYAPARERALKKQLSALDIHCRRFIELSPFAVLASTGADGLPDASPRGGQPGFVLTPDAHTLLIPDASGNNRLDTLSNIVATGRLGVLFMIPGIDETLRVNGFARLTADQALLERFAGLDRSPKVVIELRVEQAYLHCAKALMRSRLWSVDLQVERSVLPSMGQMISDQIGDGAPVESQEAMLARYRQEL
jgi:PPOX class probable FMN-dependent enzyme